MPAVVNTELGSGLVETRAVKKLEPEEVADAIVAALKFPKFDVWVPRETVAIYKLMTLLPRRGREAVARFLKADQVLAAPDKAVRAAYEDRAAHSEPGLEPEVQAVAAKTPSGTKVKASGKAKAKAKPAGKAASAPADEATEKEPAVS
jgi:hypothetical protein